jgi:UDP-glucose 4-epimerase
VIEHGIAQQILVAKCAPSPGREHVMSYQDKRILITGGLGFVGSNLAIKLVDAGARVTLLDSMLPLYGANLFNIDPIRDRVTVNFSDIRDRNSMHYLVREQDYLFHLAAQVSHVDSIIDPFTDVDINVGGTLSVLEACRKYNPGVRIIFAGTRGQYGASVKVPVDESAPTNPIGMYAITHLAAEKMALMYHQMHNIQGVSLRITNTYGPRHQMKHSRYGVANWFIRLALDDETIPVFGDGRILRDFLYIDDLTRALMMCGLTEAAYGSVFNVGSGAAISFIDLVKEIVQIAGSGRYEYAPFTAERKALEPGDYWTDITKIKSVVGWEPQVSLQEGLRRTIGYYRLHRDHYWTRGKIWRE